MGGGWREPRHRLLGGGHPGLPMWGPEGVCGHRVLDVSWGLQEGGRGARVAKGPARLAKEPMGVPRVA